MTAIDGQFTEIGGRIDRRLAELEGKIRTELDELDAQDHELAEGVETRIDGLRGEIAQAVAAQRQSIDADMRALRAQMTAVHKEFAETLARLMDEQIVKTIDARLQAVVEDLRGTIREEARLSDRRNNRNARANLVMALDRARKRSTWRPGSPDPAHHRPRHRHPRRWKRIRMRDCQGSRGPVRASRCGDLRLSPRS